MKPANKSKTPRFDQLLLDPTCGIPDSGEQAPLVLRWETRSFWKGLQRELGCNEATASVILALWSESIGAGRWVSYSRNEEHYQRFPDSRFYTKHLVCGAVKFLADRKLISHFKQDEGVRNWQSCMIARPVLLAMVERVIAEVGRPVPMRIPFGQQLVLRDENGEPIPYRVTRKTEKMCDEVDLVNRVLLKADVSCGTGQVHRVFNKNMDRGGRWYVVGGTWQRMKDYKRALITIGGEKTVELDFKCQHASMLYADAGLPIPADAYEIDGFGRKLTKLGFLIMINAESLHAAAYAIAVKGIMAKEVPDHEDEVVRKRDGKKRKVRPTKEAIAAAKLLIKAIENRHQAISELFLSDAGARLMNRDSAIAGKVLIEMARRGIVCLPVHDSFIVAESAEEVLREVMERATAEAGLPGIRIERKLFDDVSDEDADCSVRTVKVGGLTANSTTYVEPYSLSVSVYGCAEVFSDGSGRDSLQPVATTQEGAPVESQLANPSSAQIEPIETLPVVPVSARPHPLSRLPRILTSCLDGPWDLQTVRHVSTSSIAEWGFGDWLDNPSIELDEIYPEPNTSVDRLGDAETSKSGPKSSAAENDQKSALAAVSDDDAVDIDMPDARFASQEDLDAVWESVTHRKPTEKLPVQKARSNYRKDRSYFPKSFLTIGSLRFDPKVEIPPRPGGKMILCDLWPEIAF